LGGHGRTYAQFKDATWRDWQDAILLEYERLRKQGYKRISFAGSSASGALLINLLQSHYFDGKAIQKTYSSLIPS
jgi:carboxylesterase